MTLEEAFKVLEVEPQFLRTSPTNAFWCYTDTQKEAIDVIMCEMWEVMEDRRESSNFHAKVTQDHWASIKSRIESKGK